MIAVEQFLLSVDDFLKEKIVMYPNPSNGRVNLKLDSLNDVAIRVVNVFGQTVYSVEGLHTNLYSFDLTEASGMYFVIINSDEKKQIYKLILK